MRGIDSFYAKMTDAIWSHVVASASCRLVIAEVISACYGHHCYRQTTSRLNQKSIVKIQCQSLSLARSISLSLLNVDVRTAMTIYRQHTTAYARHDLLYWGGRPGITCSWYQIPPSHVNKT